MRLTCVFCGRKTIPALMLGGKAVGPTCARRAGVIDTKPRKASKNPRMNRKRIERADSETMDLFYELGKTPNQSLHARCHFGQMPADELNLYRLTNIAKS